MDANQESVREVYGDAVPRMPAPSEYAGRLITEVPQAYLQVCALNAAKRIHTANRDLVFKEWERRRNLVRRGHYDVVALPTRPEPAPAPPEPPALPALPAPAPPEPPPLVRMRVALTPEVFHAVEKLSGRPAGRGNQRFSKTIVRLLERALEDEKQCAP